MTCKNYALIQIYMSTNCKCETLREVTLWGPKFSGKKKVLAHYQYLACLTTTVSKQTVFAMLAALCVVHFCRINIFTKKIFFMKYFSRVYFIINFSYYGMIDKETQHLVRNVYEIFCLLGL